MSSIPQFIINDTNKIIKNVILNVFNEHISSFSSFIINAFASLFLKSLVNKLVLQIDKKAIIKIDKYFYSSSKRQRTIMIIFGELNFERYYFTNKKIDICVFLHFIVFVCFNL